MQAPVLSVVLVFCIIHFVSADGEVKGVGKIEDEASEYKSSSSKDESPLSKDKVSISGDDTSSSENESSSSEDGNTSSVHIGGSPANTVVPQNDGSQESMIPQNLSFRNKLSGFSEKIRQRTTSTAEYLHGIKQTIHQKVYNAAGDLYEKGTPVRSVFANQKQSHKRHLDKALEIWNKIELKGKTQEERIEMLIDVISEEMVKHLPLYTKIQPIEESSTTKYICGAKGLMRDLRSIKKVGMTIKKIDGDGFKAEINYKFNDLHFNYTEFYIKALHSVKRKGYLDIDFKGNNIKVELKISDFVKVIPKLVKKQCIVSVLNVEVTELDFVHSSLSGPRNDKTRKFLSGKINDCLEKNQEKLRTRFEQRVLINMHNALTTHNAWICKGEDFSELVKSKGGRIDDFVASEKFKNKCGQDLYIKSYKGP